MRTRRHATSQRLGERTHAVTGWMRANGQGPMAKGQGPMAKGQGPRAKGPRGQGAKGQGPRAKGQGAKGQGPRAKGQGAKGQEIKGPRRAAITCMKFEVVRKVLGRLNDLMPSAHLLPLGLELDCDTSVLLAFPPPVFFSWWSFEKSSIRPTMSVVETPSVRGIVRYFPKSMAF